MNDDAVVGGVNSAGLAWHVTSDGTKHESHNDDAVFDHIYPIYIRAALAGQVAAFVFFTNGDTDSAVYFRRHGLHRISVRVNPNDAPKQYSLELHYTHCSPVIDGYPERIVQMTLQTISHWGVPLEIPPEANIELRRSIQTTAIGLSYQIE